MARKADIRRIIVIGFTAVLAAVGLVFVPAGPASAATSCTGWYTIEVGSSPGRFVRPASGLQNTSLYGNGTSGEYWFNQFMLCRDPLWSPGDYGMFANYGGRYVLVNPNTWDVIVADNAIHNVWNLVRIRNYDGNFQTLWSPATGRYIGPAAPAGQLSATTTSLNGTNLYKVRPLPSGIPCDTAGPLC